jgi:CDP-diacylglycerol--glycerol-3-phosphate 3-phosphatidyltransferase
MMNIANCVTLSRVPLLFIVVGLMYFRIPFGSTLCFLVYLLAALSDWLDGYLARRCDIVSTFGKFMDALADKIFMVGLFVAILVLGILPQWALFFVLLIIGREFLVTGVRLVALSRGIILVAEQIGKVKTVMQIVSIGFFILWRAVVEDLTFFPKWFGPLIHEIALILFWISTYLTISSGYYYVRRYQYLFDDQGERK